MPLRIVDVTAVLDKFKKIYYMVVELQLILLMVKRE